MIRQNLETLRDVLRDSAEIAAYCQAKYSKKHSVFIGLNPQNPPRKEDNPSLSIIGVRIERAGTREKISMTIGICVEKDNLADSTANGVTTKTYEGFLEAEELREKVERAVIDARKFLLRVNLSKTRYFRCLQRLQPFPSKRLFLVGVKYGN